MEYKVEHHSDDFYIVTNDEAINFKLIKPSSISIKTELADCNSPSRRRDAVDVSAFADHLVIYERKAGLQSRGVQTLHRRGTLYYLS